MSNPICAEVIKLLEDPEVVWVACPSGCTLDLENLSVWIANIPVLNTNIYRPCAIPLSLFDKYRLWKATLTARRNIASRDVQAVVEARFYGD